MPKISVIVPAYKVEAYLDRCVQSILNQSFTDFELILIDDGSPDNCPAMCDEYAKKDERVVVLHQQNSGLSAARNAGIDWAFANSDSEWLTFIDSDDWVHEQYLELLYHAVIEHGVDISVCGFERTDGEEPVVEIDSCVVAPWNPEDFYVERNINAIVAWGKLYRKALFQNIRYPVGRIHEDEFITYKVLFQGQSIAVVDAPLYAYYTNDQGIMRSKWTPRRLDVIDAFGQQRSYFKKYGFKRALRVAVCRYIVGVTHNIIFLQKATDFSNAKRMLRKLRRKLIITLITNPNVYPFKQENYWVYEFGAPKAMWVFWTIVGITNKLKRR